MRPASTAGADVQNIRVRARQLLREHEHPEVARMRQEMDLIVDDAIANSDAHTEMVRRQIAEFRPDQARNNIEGIDDRAKQRVKGKERR